MESRRWKLLLVMVGIAALPLLTTVMRDALWTPWRWENEPFHSTVEALGALAAVFMCLVLLQRKREEDGGKLFLWGDRKSVV